MPIYEHLYVTVVRFHAETNDKLGIAAKKSSSSFLGKEAQNRSSGTGVLEEPSYFYRGEHKSRGCRITWPYC